MPRCWGQLLLDIAPLGMFWLCSLRNTWFCIDVAIDIYSLPTAWWYVGKVRKQKLLVRSYLTVEDLILYMNAVILGSK